MTIIVLEGPDGVGKTTTAQTLVKEWGAKYYQMPGHTKLGNILRPILKDKTFDLSERELALLFQASNENTIRKIEERNRLDPLGVHVLDRCGLSNVVYRHASGNKDATQLACDISQINDEHGRWRPKFGIVFVMVLPEKIRQERLVDKARAIRVGGRPEDRFDSMQGIAKEYELAMKNMAHYDGVFELLAQGMTSSKLAKAIINAVESQTERWTRKPPLWV
jgi:thymidylate kinase